MRQIAEKILGKWPPVLILARPSDLGEHRKNFQKSDILDVKSVTKRGASWQVGLPKEVAEALGLKKSKERLVFLRTKVSNNFVYVLTTGKALVPL